MNSDSYTTTVYEETSSDGVYCKMERTFTRENGEIKYTNTVTMRGKDSEQIKNVNFDSIGSFYYVNGNYYICPRGKFHLYDVNSGNHLTPIGFQNNNGADFDLKCKYLESKTLFLFFYLINGKYSIYKMQIG